MKTQRFQAGVTLIELMVGITIGLVTLLAVFQVYSTWDGRQRTGSSKNDAQITGTVAAFALEQDLRAAGLGFGPASNASDLKVGCTVTANFNGAAFTFPMLPVQIFNGAGGAPDRIVVLHGSSAARSIRELMTASGVGFTNTKGLFNRGGLAPGELVVMTNLANPALCDMVEVTATPAVPPNLFNHDQTAYQTNYLPVGNLAQSTMNLAGGTGATEYEELFDLGLNPQSNTWSIGGASPVMPMLQRASAIPVLDTTNGVRNGVVPALPIDVAEGIVDLQAQYGYDANNDGLIAANEWVDANALNAPAPAPVDWSRLLAVRFGMLARSRQYEPLPFRANNPSWSGGRFVMTDLSAVRPGGVDNNPLGADNWRAYRYMVYEAVIPMRNILWGRLL